MKKPFHLLSMGAGLLALLGLPAAARAQLGTGTIIEANVPFAFHAGEAQLPAGEYRLRTPMDGDGSVMEIRSVPEGQAALFQVIGTQNRRPAAETALVFQKYGDTYYLRRITEDGNALGDQLPVSSAEKSLRRELSLGEQNAQLLSVPARTPASSAGR